MDIQVNNKEAIRIKGKVIKVFKDSSTKKVSRLVDCDGDKIWFPGGCVRDNDDGTVDIQEWIYYKKFPNG